MSFLLKTARCAAPTVARFATPISQRTFGTTLKMSVKIDSNILSQITAAEKTLTNKDGPIPNGPTARAQKHVGQQLTAQVIREITDAEKDITGSDHPTQSGPTAIAQSILTNEGAASNNNKSSNNIGGAPITSNANLNQTSSNGPSTSEQHTGTLDSATLHKITEAEKVITGREQPVKDGPTAKAQQHAKEPITSEALHDITEGEKKITGGERVKGGPTSKAQSELGKSRN
jgi:mRNA-degrading endonuclease toxin of MazEF toxin-antitoxin module